MKIIVIGGGIGGLTAAIALSKVGIEAQVYERAPELQEVGAGISLVANALRALDVIGLGAAVRSEALAGVPACFRDTQGRVLLGFPADEVARQIGSVALMHRAELLALLKHQVDPGRLHLGHECVGFEQEATCVTARFQNGETATGDALIGADGLKSAVRGPLVGDHPARYAGYTAWRTVVEFNHQNKLTIGETMGRGRRFGIVPMTRERVYWFATHNSAEGERDPEGQTKQVLSELFQGWHEPIEALIAASKEGSILRNDIYDMEPLKSWAHGRVVLLGDAAHAMTPNLGQGGCQAIEDAVVLAACLKKDASVQSALQEYQQRRIPRVTQFVLRSRQLGDLGQRENPVLCWMRNIAMRAIPKRMAASQMKSSLDFEILNAPERSLFHP